MLRDGLGGKSPWTLKKTWCELVMMFRWAEDEGVIDNVPYLSRRRKSTLVDCPPKQQRPVLTNAEVTALFYATRKATYPRVRGLPAPLLWQVAIVLFYLYGIRTRDLLSLRWEDVLFSERLNKFEALKTSKLQGLPMTKVAERYLRLLQGPSRSGQVFPGFKTKGHLIQTGTKSGTWKQGYYATWRAEICVEAGQQDEVWLKHFREAMVTRYNGIDHRKGLGSWIAGHYVPGVSAQNYDLPSQEIREMLESASYPSCFDGGDERQMKLF